MTNFAIRLFAVAVSICLSSTSRSDGAASIPWDDDLRIAFQQSALSGKPILLHFYSNNCPPCKMLDTRAFKDERVVSVLSENTIPLKINVDNQRSLADRYEVTRWPTDVYLHPNGDEIGRSVSPQDPEKYCDLVNRISAVNRGWITERIASQNPPASGAQSSLATNASVASSQGASVAGAQVPSERTSSEGTLASSKSRTAGAPRTGDSSSIPVGNQYANRSVVTKSDTFATPVTSVRTEANPYCSNMVGPDGVSAMQCSSGVDPNGPSYEASGVSHSQQQISGGTALASDSVPAQTVGYARESSQNRYAQASVRLGGVMSEDTTPALDGCCAVTLRTQAAWVTGSPSYAIKHRGRVYHCVSEEARQRFLEQPDFYSPILSGYDIVHFCETGKLEPGRREFGCESGGHIFLFKDAATYETFRSQVLLYLQQVSGSVDSGLVANVIDGDSVRR